MVDNSVTNRAYHLLREEVIECRLAPGSRVNMSSLQAQFSISQAAVREALSRLTSEGLVEIERHRGFRIAEVSPSGFRELMDACLALELPMLRSSIQNGGRDWELNLVATYHRSIHTLRLFVEGKEGLGAYSSERLAFYEALLGACNNKWMLWSWRTLYTQLVRYRHLYLPLAKFELVRNPDHYDNLKSALERNVDEAIAKAIKNNEIVICFVEELMAGKSSPSLGSGRGSEGATMMAKTSKSRILRENVS